LLSEEDAIVVAVANVLSPLFLNHIRELEEEGDDVIVVVPIISMYVSPFKSTASMAVIPVAVRVTVRLVAKYCNGVGAGVGDAVGVVVGVAVGERVGEVVGY